MRKELERIVRLPRTARLPFSRKSNAEKAASIVVGLTGLPEYARTIEEVSSVMNVIRHPEHAIPRRVDLGYPTADIDTTIELLRARVEAGLLSEEIGQKYLATLLDQRELSLQRPPTLGEFVRSTVDLQTHALARRVTRRGALIVGGVAGGVAGGTIVTVVAAEWIVKGGWTVKVRGDKLILLSQPKQDTVDTVADRALDTQPKIELASSLTDISKNGWLARSVPDGSRFQPSTVREGVAILNNGYVFQFGGENNGITIRAYKKSDEVVPFLRVYPVQGNPKDYVLRTSYDRDRDLVTEVVKFENPGQHISYFAQFKPLVSGDTFKFAGQYMELVKR